jgi:outer membrane protein TolC
MLKTISLIIVFAIAAVDLGATSMKDLFTALKKQPVTKVDTEISKIAKAAEKKVNAAYYPSINIFANYTHYNSPTNLRPLDPLATAKLNSNGDPLPFSQTIQKIGIKATVPIFIKELASLSQKVKYLAKSTQFKKRLNFLQNEAIIVASNASLKYIDSLLTALRATRKSLIKTESNLKISVKSGRTPAIALDKIDEKINQIDITINNVNIKRIALLSNIAKLTGIKLEAPVDMFLNKKIKKDNFFALKPLEEVVKASMSDYKAAKEKRYYPKVALSLLWSENYAQHDVKYDKDVHRGYGYYSLGISMPLFDKTLDSDMQLKKIIIMKDKMKLQKTKNELASEADTLWKQLKLLLNSEELKKNTIKKEENLLTYAKVAYKEGRMTEEDYLRYEDALISSKSNYYEAVSQKWQTIAKLAVIYGNDLEGVIK